MAVINSLVLYFLLLSVMTYSSYKMNYYKYETKTANEKRTGYAKIIKSLNNGMTGRSLLGFYDTGNDNSVNFPELAIDNGEEASKINEGVGSEDSWRLFYDALSEPALQLSSKNYRVPRIYTTRYTEDTPTSSPTSKVERSSLTRQTKSWMLYKRLCKHNSKNCILVFDENGVMRWSTDGKVSRSSTDGQISTTSSDDIPTLSPASEIERPNLTRQTKSSTSSTELSKRTTINCKLVFDENGNIQWSTDRRVSQSSTDRRISTTSSNDIPTSSPTSETDRLNQIRQTKSWTPSTELSKRTTMNRKLAFDENGVMRWSTDEKVSRSSTDGQVSKTSSNDIMTSSPASEVKRPNLTRQTKSSTSSTELSKRTTINCKLVFDENGNIQWSTDGRVSQSSTDRRISTTSSNDIPTSSPTSETDRLNQIHQTKSWTPSTELSKRTTMNHKLVLDENGNIQWSTDGRVSQSTTERRVPTTSSSHTLTSSPTSKEECPDITQQTKSYTFSIRSFKYITKNCILVIDENGIMRWSTHGRVSKSSTINTPT